MAGKPNSGVAAADRFHPNPWNPNKMAARDYARLIHDIQAFGFVDPVTVRPHPQKKGDFQIIDGENRWRAASDLGLDVFYFDIGPVDDATAKKLTIALNELRGQYDPRQMGDLLNELLKDESPQQLLEQLPFTEEALAGLVGFKGFDWKGLDKPQPGDEKKERAPQWVERTFRMPPDVAEVVDQALAHAHQMEPGITDIQALEMIAADFLGR